MVQLRRRLKFRDRSPRVQARLVPLTDATVGVVHLDGSPLLVGRGSDCGLICRDSALSRHHARLSRVGSVWRLEDLDSANGTTVDGRNVSTVDLTPGNTITLGGRISYRFEIETPETRSISSFWTGLFCPQLVPEAGGQPFILRRRLSVVGRNKTSDLCLNASQISAIHARIIRRPGLITLRDTGSRNGTAVNGNMVRQTELAMGDRVVFGDVAFVLKRSWLPTGRALTAIGSGGILVALMVLLSLLFFSPREKSVPLWTREMYVNQVESSLVAVVNAYDRIPPARAVALAQFDIARRSLIAAELLRPDRQTDAEINSAVRAAALAPEVHKVLRGRDMVEILAEIERDPARSVVKDRESKTFDLTRELSLLVAEFGIDTRDTAIPAGLVAAVDHYVEFWSVQRRKSTVAAIKRGQPYLDMMRRELRRQRLPQIFCYLPFIESSYDARITSKAGARGLWQFMPGTARDYGLKVGADIDQRTDPQLSTRAACQYLEYLLHIFGPNSFMCAVAAYNKGHNGMRRCLDHSGDLQSTWKFWNLAQSHDGCLREETIEYVPRFLAAVVIFRNPQEFGLDKLD